MNSAPRLAYPEHVNGQAVRIALGGLLPDNSAATALRLRGAASNADGIVFYRLDPVEHERRTATVAAWLDDFRPLEALMSLPVGCRVPRADLEPGLRREVRRLPHGSVHADNLTATRLAVRPLRVDLIVTAARGWKSGLAAASQFAPFSRRAMLLERVPRRIDELLFEADFYGVGVLAVEDGTVRVLLAPASWRALRPTTAAWWFVEQVYRKLGEAGALA